MDLLIFLGLGVFALALIFAVFFKKIVIDRQIEKLNDLEDEVEKAKLKAKEIVEEAERDAVSKAKEIELKAKEKAYQIKEEVEKEARNSKNEIAQKEARIIKKEEILDGKIEKIEIKSLELEKINDELEERRKELVKQAQKMGEQAKVAIRNLRRDANDLIKKGEKDGSIAEDEAKKELDDIQKLTDDHIKAIDAVIATKEKDIKEF